MVEQKTSNTPVILAVIGTVLFVIGVVIGVWTIVGVVSWASDVEDYPRFVAPGSMTVDFPRAEGFGLYAEQRSVIDGQTHIASRSPASLDITIEDAAGNTIPYRSRLNSDFTYEAGQYESELIGMFTLNAPGSVTIRAEARPGSGSGTTVLAIGDHPTEIFGGIAMVLLGFCGGGALALLGIVLGVIGAVLLINRRKAL